LKKVIKPKPMFNRTSNIDQVFSTFRRRFPNGLHPDESNIVESGGIDLSKYDVEDQISMIRGQFLKINIWLVETEEDLTKLLTYVEKYEHIAYDTETTSIDKAKTVSNILMWSLSVKQNEGFVIPNKFNKQMFEWITTSTKQIWAHNAGFDNRIVHWNTGKHIINANCSLLLKWSYLNDTVKTPSLSLKELTKKTFGTWSEKGNAYDITNLTEDDIGNPVLQHYAGTDTCALINLIQPHLKEFKETTDVEMEDVLPAELPKDRSYTRMWFYKNISRKLLPITIEFMNNGLPLNLDKVHQLDTHLDDILDKAENGVRGLKTVQTYWEKLRGNKASEASDKYLETVDVNSVKIYKSTNQDFINIFVETMYPDKVLPSKAKNWSATVVKTFDVKLAAAIKAKDLESLRDIPPYNTIFEKVEKQLTISKIQDKIAKTSETSKNKASKVMLDFEFKPLASAQQKKFILQKGFGVTSNTKSMTTGEDSFNRAELERLCKEVQEGTELHTYLTHLITYSGSSIVKKNFVKNFLEHNENGVIYPGVRLCGTKSFRLSGGGKLNPLNIPSSGSVFSKPVKKCISVPSDDWVFITSDYEALEENAMGNITQDPTKLKILSQKFDIHCKHSTSYFPRIQEILGKDDGSLEWNKRYKAETFNNPELNKLRSSSKGISFALAYLAGISGLFKAVGYLGDTFEDKVKINSDTYSFTLDIQDNGDYFTAKQNAKWIKIDDYKGNIPQELEEFFKVAVYPAKTMHYAYHNNLYPGLKKYREEIILKQVKKHKDFHMGLGAYINQTKRLNNGAIRTLNNVSNQFFSLLPLIALTKFMKKVRKRGYENDIKPVISIYDSVYILVRNNKEVIKWVADTLQPILEDQYLVDQPIKLVSDIEISDPKLGDGSWADFISYKDWLKQTT